VELKISVFVLCSRVAELETQLRSVVNSLSTNVSTFDHQHVNVIYFELLIEWRPILPRDAWARYCYGKVVCLSVRPSTSRPDVEISWSHGLEIFKNNFTVS